MQLWIFAFEWLSNNSKLAQINGLRLSGIQLSSTLSSVFFCFFDKMVSFSLRKKKQRTEHLKSSNSLLNLYNHCEMCACFSIIRRSIHRFYPFETDNLKYECNFTRRSICVFVLSLASMQSKDERPLIEENILIISIRIHIFKATESYAWFFRIHFQYIDIYLA